MPFRFFSDRLMAYKQSEFTRYLSSTLVLFALATPTFAQGFRFGLKAGVPMTDYFETGTSVFRRGHIGYSAATRRYTVGASTEWRFRGGFGFELDALYKRMGYVRGYGEAAVSLANGTFDVLENNETFDVKGHSWDFPMMVKYRFGRILQPYVAAGVVLRHIGPVRARGVGTTHSFLTGAIVTTPIDTDDPSELRDRNFAGLAIAVGVEFGRGRLRLLPEFRYTRWTANIAQPSGLLRFDPNQVEFLLGFLF